MSLELLRTGSPVTVHVGSVAGGTQSLYIAPTAGQTLVVHMFRFYHNDGVNRDADAAIGNTGSEQVIWFNQTLAPLAQVTMRDLGFVAPLIIRHGQRFRVTVYSLAAGKLLYLSNHHYVVLQK